MKENELYSAQKSLIEKARNNQTIMMICHHEYLGDYGKPPPENWEPSDEEVLRVAERAGFN
jgi:hypothetical protein